LQRAEHQQPPRLLRDRRRGGQEHGIEPLEVDGVRGGDCPPGEEGGQQRQRPRRDALPAAASLVPGRCRLDRRQVQRRAAPRCFYAGRHFTSLGSTFSTMLVVRTSRASTGFEIRPSRTSQALVNLNEASTVSSNAVEYALNFISGSRTSGSIFSSGASFWAAFAVSALASATARVTART